MPERASCRLDTTSWALLPMEETMPRPVTTTRLMAGRNPSDCRQAIWREVLRVKTWSSRGRCGRQRLGGFLDEQTDFQVLGFIDYFAVHLHDPVGDADDQLAHDHALQVDDICDLLGGG